MPKVELPPEVEFTDQVREAFEEPVTDAVNLYEEPARILALAGATETVIEPELGGGSGVVTVCDADPQAARSIAKASGYSGLQKDIVVLVCRFRGAGTTGRWNRKRAAKSEFEC